MANAAWKDVISEVLKNAGEAMHYKNIAEEIEKQGLRKNLGATPANTVYATIHLSMKNEADSPFIKTNPGVFMLRADAATVGGGAAIELAEPDQATAKIVKSAGMFWHANKVVWKTKPKLLGQQQQGAKEIDFADQIGIYLLHDRSRIIYVGRSVDRPLAVRLSEHTKDRLNGRWDRFSWFGLKGVQANGKLTEPEFEASQNEIISLMEAVLIEALEPPQNRKRGDDFSDIEYLQVEDSEKKDQKKKALMGMLQAELEDE